MIVTALLLVKHDWLLREELKNLWPFRLSFLLKFFVVDGKSTNFVASNIKELQVVVVLFDQVFLLHFLGRLFVTIE